MAPWQPAFFPLYHLSPHLIVRHIGNRFHILFQLATKLYYIQDYLIDFLQTTHTKNPSYTNQIIKDLSYMTENWWWVGCLERFRWGHG